VAFFILRRRNKYMNVKDYNMILDEFYNNIAENKDCTEVIQQIIDTQIEPASSIIIK
jgi:hypothetical protein